MNKIKPKEKSLIQLHLEAIARKEPKSNPRQSFRPPPVTMSLEMQKMYDDHARAQIKISHEIRTNKERKLDEKQLPLI